MKRKIFTVVPLFLFLLSFMFSGCDVLNPVVSEQEEVNSSELHNKNGLLIIKLTDAPFPISLIKEANVAINKIDIRKENEGFLSIGACTKLSFQLPHDTQPQKRAGRKHKSCFLTLIIICIGIVIGGLIVGTMAGQDGLLLGAILGGFLGLLLGR